MIKLKNLKVLILTFLILLSECHLIFSQNKPNVYKIDSVFNDYINFLRNEDTTIYESNDGNKVCIYEAKRQLAIDFLENISGLYLKREKGSNCWLGILTIETFADIDNWEIWYNANKGRLIWSNDGKTINKIKDSQCVDYLKVYPSQIRFIENDSVVPISTPPSYIKELERNSQRTGLEPRQIRVESNIKKDSLLKLR